MIAIKMIVLRAGLSTAQEKDAVSGLGRILRLALLPVALICSATPVFSYTPVRTAAADSELSIEGFYRSREGKPLWLANPKASEHLLKLLGSAEVDGISTASFQLGSLVVAIREASTSDPTARRGAEIMLSKAFLTYARAMQRDPRVGVIYVDAALKPMPSSSLDLLRAAAQAPSLEDYVKQIGWMNPVYGQLRQALRPPHEMAARDRYLLALNLQRARALPWDSERYILVNTANQRLYMFEDSKIVDEMKVVAGRIDAQTPLMNAYIRFAVLNPYWNVPTDIAARLAPNVLKQGPSYLRKQGYEVVAGFGDNPKVVDTASVDWKAVAAGKATINLRQMPGPRNAMGRVKFMFPNSQGVWLHDTPSRELFANAERLDSAGCIRLEDAKRLGTWLFKRPLSLKSARQEKRLVLPKPVPVFITYMTAVTDGSSVSFVKDVYSRDPPPS